MKRARGFTLLEVLLAFVILAVAMGLLMSMLSRGLGQVRRAQDESEAAMYAQSLLDSVGILDTLKEGQTDGDWASGRYHYQLLVREVEDPTPKPLAVPGAPPPAAIAPPQLFRLDLSVAWGAEESRRELHFSTLRARTAPLEGLAQ
jgi:general secretion pathway protein I